MFKSDNYIVQTAYAGLSRMFSRYVDPPSETWTQWIEYALKGDLTGNYYISTVEGHNLNYTANEEKIDTFSVSGIPSTYRVIAVVDVYSGSPRVNVGNRFFEYDKKTITASTKNMSSDTLSAYVYARVLCERM